jgi:hypothetical protein
VVPNSRVLSVVNIALSGDPSVSVVAASVDVPGTDLPVRVVVDEVVDDSVHRSRRSGPEVFHGAADGGALLEERVVGDGNRRYGRSGSLCDELEYSMTMGPTGFIP